MVALVKHWTYQPATNCHPPTSGSTQKPIVEVSQRTNQISTPERSPNAQTGAVQGLRDARTPPRRGGGPTGQSHTAADRQQCHWTPPFRVCALMRATAIRPFFVPQARQTRWDRRFRWDRHASTQNVRLTVRTHSIDRSIQTTCCQGASRRCHPLSLAPASGHDPLCLVYRMGDGQRSRIA